MIIKNNGIKCIVNCEVCENIREIQTVNAKKSMKKFLGKTPCIKCWQTIFPEKEYAARNKKLSECLIGKTKSLETRKKISEGHKGLKYKTRGANKLK